MLIYDLLESIILITKANTHGSDDRIVLPQEAYRFMVGIDLIDSVMKFIIPGEDAGAVPGGDRIFEVLLDPVKVRKVRFRQRRHAPNEKGWLKENADIEYIFYKIWRDFANTGAAIGFDDHEPLDLKLIQCFANWRHRNPVAFAKPGKDQTFVSLEEAVDDIAAKLVPDAGILWQPNGVRGSQRFTHVCSIIANSTGG